MEFTTPPALSPGDRVAVVRPCATADGGDYPDHLVDLGIERLEGVFDLEADRFPSVERDRGWLYDHPEARARELEWAFRDPEIGGVIAAIGGNDGIRVLGHLDPEVFREHPTRFYGTSDNTSFAAFLREQAIVSFYGGTLFTDVAEPGGIDDYTREFLDRAFFEETLGEIHAAERFSDQGLDWNDPANLECDLEYEPADGWRWHGDGRVEGRTWGGCLEVLATHFVADRCLPEDPAGSVLLLETSEELPTDGEVRRLLTGMGERGYLDVGAVLVGRAKARSFREERAPGERERYRERQREAIRDVVRRYDRDAIVVTDVEFGHTRPVAPVPVGGRCVVDADNRRLAFP